MKKILIVYEKSKKIGSGHYFRSLRLFKKLKKFFYVSIFEIKNKKILKKKLLNDYDLYILDLKKYPKLNINKKIILFENLGNKIKNSININPLDIYLENSGPEFFIFPEYIKKINYKINFDKKKIIKILIIQGADDSNNKILKLVNFLENNKKKIKFKFKLIIKTLSKTTLKVKKPHKEINKVNNMSNIFKDVNIAISSVGNTAFELGYVGIPTIHFTIEKREIRRSILFDKMNLAKFVHKDLNFIVKELNKIYFNDKYRKNLVKRRKNFFRKKNKIIKIIKDAI
tara:strand:- start:781 stop:1635 length:855 start_codon:yes stop_codon:yes gene_type:complete